MRPPSTAGRALLGSAWAPGAIAFALLVILCAVRYRSQGFLSAATAFNLLTDNAVLGTVAVGMTLVIVSGGIDLSVGAVMSAASVLCAMLLMNAGWNVYATIGCTLAAGVAYGAVTGFIVHVTRLQAFIVTLAGMFLVRGLGFLMHLESVAIDHEGHASLASMRTPLVVMLGSVAAGQLLLSRTRLGLRIRALGGGEHAAKVQGVPVLSTRVAVYALSGLFSALAGITLTFYLSSGSHLEGVGMELDAIAAVVIGGAALTGGKGSVVGTLIGVLTVGLVLTAITTYEGTLNSGLTRVAIGAMLLAFVTAQRFLRAGSGGRGAAAGQ